MEKAGHTQTNKLFGSPFLERLTRTHIVLPLTIYYGTSLILLSILILYHDMRATSVLLYFLSGFLFFTLIEYLIHRFGFHMNGDTELKQKFTYTFHGIHHDYPRDKKRLAMPPLVSVFIAALLVSFSRLIFGHPGLAVGAGILSGYASYLAVHYSVHALKPPKNFLRYLWKHYAIHHYKNKEVAFGVSSPLWDIVFGTMPKE